MTDNYYKALGLPSKCIRCNSPEIRTKEIVHDCYECGATWETEISTRIKEVAIEFALWCDKNKNIAYANGAETAFDLFIKERNGE